MKKFNHYRFDVGYTDNTLEDTEGKKTISINATDQGNVEKAGYSLNTSASTIFSELADDAELLEELKEEKREEVRQLREKARDIEEKWEL